MDLTQIKSLYDLLTTSDSIFDIRGKLHQACDKINFDALTAKYLASENVIRMINYIKKEYYSMIEAEKTVYKISDEELENRINKLKKLDELFKNCDNPYIRFDAMVKMFKNPGIMHKTYTLLIRYGKDDSKLSELRPILNKFDIFYNEFRKSFKSDVHKTVANAYQEKQKNDELNYAKWILNEYIISKDSYIIDEFLNRYGIMYKTFNYLVDVVKNNDLSLYYEFVIKKESNDKIMNTIYTSKIDDLGYAVKNGTFVYGNMFNLLEFIKEVPFKDSDDFEASLDDFMAIHNKIIRETINSYVKENNLNSIDAFKVFKEEELMNAKIIINGIILNEDAIKTIISYLKYRSIPLYKSAFGAASRMYLNDELPKTIISNNKNDNIKPILIPKYKKMKKDAF